MLLFLHSRAVKFKLKQQQFACRGNGEVSLSRHEAMFVSHVAKKTKTPKPPAASDLKSQHCGCSPPGTADG